MARKDQLPVQRAGTVINVTSKQQETDIIQALRRVIDHIHDRFQTAVSLTHEKQWFLSQNMIRRREFRCLRLTASQALAALLEAILAAAENWG